MKTKVSYIRLLLFLGCLTFSEAIQAQVPCKVLVGYYQASWGTYMRITDVNSNYNVICLAFLDASGSDNIDTDNVVGDLNFYARQNAQLIADIPVVQAQGKKVLMSVGGASGSFKLNSTADVNTFVSKVQNAVQTYGLDGIDIDLEQSVYLNQSGTISNPSPHIANLISGLQQLLAWYQTTYGKKMMLTLVPETAYVTGGLSTYQTNTYGVAYLPVIEALRNDIDLLMVQLYNAGQNIGLDGVAYTNGTADYIVSQTEAIINGFTCKSGRGVYSGLPASKVVVMLPSDTTATSSGYASPAVVKSAVDYLLGVGPRPGSYRILKPGAYPDLRGMGTWSINIDNDMGYLYASNYASIFQCVTTGVEQQQTAQSFNLYPNPAKQQITVEKIGSGEQQLQLVNMWGTVLREQVLTEEKTKVDISTMPSGLYIVKIGEATHKLVID
jgi:chitinase